MVEIVEPGETQVPRQERETCAYVTGMMPFLDELDVESEPPRMSSADPSLFQ